jgi:UDP-galactopyranose mutase
MTSFVRIVGAGLAGATVGYLLEQAGIQVELVEAQSEWGGQLRTGSAGGTFYEPTGAHIFHTSDDEVWHLVSGLVQMRPYRHVVRTEVFGSILSWPPQLDELRQLTHWPVVERELQLRPARPRGDNFETWCIDLMGETLYREFIESYTRKQWGRDPRELAAAWAPRRIELRDDGDPHLFRDKYQGWPVGGYRRLVDGLLRNVPVIMGQPVGVADWDVLCNGTDAVVLTCALDEFFEQSLRPLAWRGVRLVSHYLPGSDFELPCGVLNTPSADRPYTRVIETKWMSGQTEPGTVVSYEYPGADARHYPVDDVHGANRARQREYEALLAGLPGPIRRTAGRLATYTYIDMDQAIRQGMNVARSLLAQLS